MDSKELGLVLGEKLLGLEALHYGYWHKPPTIFTIAEIIRAQKNYTEFILQQIDLLKIKKQKNYILDVGCGTGIILEQLLAKGYQVDAVSPSLSLQDKVAKRLKNKSLKYTPQIYKCLFEELLQQKDIKKYSLVFFSESYQYIPLENSFAILPKILTKRGTVLICDFFKKNMHSPEAVEKVGGGHLLESFKNQLSNSSFSKIKELDITKNCAPTIEIGSYFLQHSLFPSLQILDDYLNTRYGKKYSLLRKLFLAFNKKQFTKLKGKYFLGKRSGSLFAADNKYLLLLLKQK